jgi:hypothetical protein
MGDVNWQNGTDGGSDAQHGRGIATEGEITRGVIQ